MKEKKHRNYTENMQNVTFSKNRIDDTLSLKIKNQKLKNLILYEMCNLWDLFSIKFCIFQSNIKIKSRCLIVFRILSKRIFMRYVIFKIFLSKTQHGTKREHIDAGFNIVHNLIVWFVII